MKRRFFLYFLLFLVAFAILTTVTISLGGRTASGGVSPLGKTAKNWWRDFFEGKGNRTEGSTDVGGFGALLTAPPFRVPILMHHYVEMVTDERDFVRRSMSIRPDFFERQLSFLLEKGYTFITLDELYAAAQNQASLPEKPIILTFDDGYRDFYTDAFPILQKYGVRAINFIVYNFIGRDRNYMDETQIREMLASGLVEIGSHTLSHLYLTHLSTAEAEKEIKESKSLLEERFGVAIDHFAYPGGYSTSSLEEVMAAAGYLTAVGAQKGEVSNDSDLYYLPRIRVGNLTPEELLRVIERASQ